MKKRKEELAKGAVIVIFVVAIGLLVLGFVALFLAAYLQEKGVSASIYTPIGCSFFIFDVAAIVLLCLNSKKILIYDIKKEMQKINENDCLVLEDATKNKIIDACVKYKFVERDCDYLYKRKISFFNDFINYFVRIIDTANIEEDVPNEISKFDNKKYKNKNKCLLLFVFLDKVEEKDLEALKNCATSFVLLETVMSRGPYCDNAVIVFVDAQSRKAYLVASGNFGPSVYKYGVKMVKKLLA